MPRGQTKDGRYVGLEKAREVRKDKLEAQRRQERAASSRAQFTIACSGATVEPNPSGGGVRVTLWNDPVG